MQMGSRSLLYSLFYFLFVFQAFAEESLETKGFEGPQEALISEYELNPSLHLMNSVNLLDGQIYHMEEDIPMEGSDPLPFIRTYVGGDQIWYGECGLRSGSNFPVQLQLSNDLSDLLLEQFGGSSVKYQRIGQGQQYRLSQASISNGWVNTSGEEICGRSNSKNQLITYDSEKKTCLVRGADGSLKLYKLASDQKNSKYATYLLSEETLPDGHQVHYRSKHNPKEGSSYQVYSTNSQGKRLRSLEKRVYKTNGMRQHSYLASNGRGVDYYLSDLDPAAESGRHYLQDVVPSDKPAYSYLYSPSDSGYSLHRIARPAGRFLQFGYDASGQVSQIFIPDAEGKEFPLYQISYQANPDDPSERAQTVVTDAAGLSKRLFFAGNRIYKIEYHALEPGLKEHIRYRAELFRWSDDKESPLCGSLLGKAILDRNGALWGAWSYTYDARHNITEERVFGNLSGLQQKPLSLSTDWAPGSQDLAIRDAIQGSCESLAKRYTYSDDGFNLKLSEQEAGGPLFLYSYYSNTDMLKSRLTLVEGQVVRREFYAYDEDTVLIGQVVDNGSSREEDDLTGVTERRMQRITPQGDPEQPGFSQPQSVAEYYLDVESGKQVLLKEERFFYAAGDRLIRKDLIDSSGLCRYSLHYAYGPLGALVEESDPVGRITRYEYDANKNCIRSELIGSGFHIEKSYDFNNRLISLKEVHPDQTLVERYTYDSMGRKVSHTNFLGYTTEYAFDSLGREISEKLPEVTFKGCSSRPVRQKGYDIANHVIFESDENGGATHKTYNFYGQPVTITDPSGAQESFEYHLNGTMKKHVRKNGSYVLYTYDAFKRPLTAETYDASGTMLYVEKQEYDAFHLIRSIDARGQETAFRYDGAGRLIEEVTGSGPMARRKTYAYDALGRLFDTKVWTSPDSYIATQDTFDLLNRLLSRQVADETGLQHRFERYLYDFAGNQIAHHIAIDAGQDACTLYAYNTRKEMTASIDPLGNKTSYIHDYHYIDALGHQVLKKTTIDPLGLRSIELFDPLGRLVFSEKRNVCLERIACRQIERDLAGNPIREVHARFSGSVELSPYVIEQTFDAMGRIVKIVEQPDSAHKETRHLYTSYGALEAIIKPDGVVLEHSYHPAGYLKGLKASDGSIHYAYSYDLEGNLTLAKDLVHQVQTRRSFNAFNQLEQEELGNGLKMGYQYDLAGRLAELTLPGNSGVRYHYSGPNLVKVERLDAAGKSLYEHAYCRFNLIGAAEEQLLPLQAGALTLDYDSMSRISSIQSKHWSLEIPSAGYDSAGNLRSYSVQDPLGKESICLEYDPLYQLKKEQGPFQAVYSYDSLHNRLKKGGAEYEISPLNQVLSAADQLYSYDLNGNLLKKEGSQGSLHFAYDALNRLSAVEKPLEYKVTYLYDSFGRRLAKTYFSWDGASASWLLDREQSFLFQGQKEMGAYSQGAFEELRLFGSGKGEDLGTAVFIEVKDAVYAPIYDFRGSLMALIDSKSGELAEFYRTSAFGERLTYAAGGKQLAQGRLPWGFASKRFDAESGLIYFGKRYYDVEIGKWLTPDPQGFVDGPNLYAFIQNRPLFYLDFYGSTAELVNPIASFFSNGKEKLGSYLEWGARNALYSSHLQYQMEGVGRWMQGLSFQHQASWEVQSISGSIAGKSLPNGRVRYVPGIGTTLESCQNMASQISKQLKGYEVFYTCNQTKGLLTDAVNAGAYKISDWLFDLVGAPPIINRAISHLYQDVAQDFASHASSENYTEYIIAHSRGGLETDVACGQLPDALKKQTSIYSLGSFQLASTSRFKSTVNYVNPHDAVPKLDINHYFSSKSYNIIYNNYATSWTPWRGITDHLLESGGYQSSMKKICAGILSDEGIH
ncbi:MAG: rhs25 [Chlamydiales bacterium]|jgi:RHS repeat-associated protein|nr:rhs25 [Chlamydiales bacterium]